MANPIKILELKGEDFAKGYSYFQDFPFGGNMREISNFDPFLDYGYFTPSLGYTVASAQTSTPKFITNWNESGTAKLYVHAENKLFEVLDGSPYTTTDESAEINVVEDVTGAIFFQNKYIYAQADAVKLYANTFPVASGSNTLIFDSGGSNTLNYTPFCIAPDKNLYFGMGNICRITDATTTNNGTYYALESGMVTRDLVSDGRYLVAIADNNSSHTKASAGNVGSNRCQVLFYDVNNGRSTADYIYEFTDSYVSAVKFLDGNVYIFGKDNLWVCNSQTAPKAIFNFQAGSTIQEPPKYFFQVHQRNNVIYWVGATQVYAYGSKVAGAKKVFFQPYPITATCITTSGDNVYIGTNGASSMLYVLNSSQTKTSATISTGYFSLPQPYTFAYLKVVMKAKLSSGGSVSAYMNSLAGEITDSSTKSFSTIGAKQQLIFNKVADSGNMPVANFNDFNVIVVSNQAVSKIEVWAYPVDNYDQNV